MGTHAADVMVAFLGLVTALVVSLAVGLEQAAPSHSPDKIAQQHVAGQPIIAR